MADIAKCSGTGCDKKEQCYRFTAPSNEYAQWYALPIIVDGKCESFWDNENRRG